MSPLAGKAALRPIGGFGDIQRFYDAFLIDAWGVLHDGRSCYPGVIETLERLRRLAKPVVVLSNAARREAALRQELAAVGIAAESYHAVVSSGELTWQALAEGRLPFATTGKGYYLGPERSRSLCDGLEIDWVDSLDDCEFVLDTGAPEGNPATADRFAPLLRAMLDRQLPMICANPDLLAVRAGRPGISAGAIARLYQRMGASQVVYFGKPDAEIFVRAHALLGATEKNRLLMIGDGLETDIAGAAGFGIESLLITGGIHAAELAAGGGEGIDGLVDKYAVRPTRYCSALRW